MKHADTTPAFPHLIIFSEKQDITLYSLSRPSTLSLTCRPAPHEVNGVLATQRPFGKAYLARLSKLLASVVSKLSCASFV